MNDSYPLAESAPGAFEFLGVRLHPVDVAGVHEFMSRVIESRQKALVLNLNVHCVNLACEHKWFRDFLASAALVFCDGDGVRWGVRILGKTPPPKITYAKWMWQLGEFCEKKGYTLAFLGGKPGVSQKAADRMTERFPGLKIISAVDGYFRKQGSENDRVIERINRLSPDILIVGMGMPIQERWLRDHWKTLNAHIFLNGGAVFDYVSGDLARAPGWMLRFNLEWLYRLSQEPGRLFGRYVIGNPLFMMRIFGEKLKRKKL